MISVTANVAPALVARMCAAALSEDWVTARAINRQLLRLNLDLFLEANPIPLKWAMAKMGLCGPALRLPMTPLSQVHHETVLAALKSAGVLG